MKILSSKVISPDHRGGCTVEYTLNSPWRKLFGMNTTFKCYCDHPEVVGRFFYYFTRGVYDWKDENQKVITDPKILNVITTLVGLHYTTNKRYTNDQLSHIQLHHTQ